MAGEVEVERLVATLEVGGLAGFTAGMQAADRVTQALERVLDQLTVASKVTSGALETVRMTSAQATETATAAASIIRSVDGVAGAAQVAAGELSQVKLDASQATSTAATAAAEVAALRTIASQAADTRRSLEGLAGAQIATGGANTGGLAGGLTVAGLRSAGFGSGGTAGTLALLGRDGDPSMANTLRLLGWSTGGFGGGSDVPRVLSGAAGGGGAGGGGLMSALGWGGGMFGMAKFGSLLGLAGFGAERAITSTLGVAGSIGGGLLGGGLLALGGAGTMAVGTGTDLAGISQAAGDTKNVTQGLDALQTAIATYGKNSQQAAVAQAQLNATLGSFSPVARNAVLAAAQTAVGFHAMFNAATGEAEKTGAEIINQAMQVGEKFLPTIGKYATQNMGIIQQGLQPLFKWLQSPAGGLGIFQNLEQIFQNNLPTAVHAGSQALEVFMHLVDDAAQYTGGLTQKLDAFFTRMNTPAGLSSMASEVGKLIDLFKAWAGLLGSVAGAIYDLVKPAVGFGEQLAAGLTVLIDKTRTWLSAAGTQDVLHAVFAAHLSQLQGLFGILEALGPALGTLARTFLSIEAAVAGAVGGGFKLLADVLKEIMRIPFVGMIAGTAAAFALTSKAVTGATAVITFLLTKFGLLPKAAVDASAPMVAAINETTAAVDRLNVTLSGTGMAAAKAKQGVSAATAGMDESVAATTGLVGTLKASLLSMAGSVIPIAIAVSVINKSKMGQSALDKVGLGFLGRLPVIGGADTQAAALGAKAGNALGHVLGTVPKGQTVSSWLASGTGGKPITPSQAILGMSYAQAKLANPHLTRSEFSSEQAIAKAGPGTQPPAWLVALEHAISPHSAAWYMKHYGTPSALQSGIPPVTGAGAAGIQPNTLATNAGNLASYYGSLAGLYTGGTAVKYLRDQQAALKVQQAALEQQLATAGKKNASAITAQLQQTQVSLIQVGQAIKNAVVVTGSALLPSALKSKLAAQTAQFNSASQYASVLTGQAAQDYNTVLLSDLQGRQQDLQAEVNYLKSKLAGAKGAQKTAIQQELTKVQSNLSSVQQSIVSNLQSTVQALQSSASTVFQNVQSEMDAQLGNLYYQNGLQTPSEALLAQMQAQDQLSSLQQSIASAQAQLKTDLGAAGGPNAATIAADKQAVAAAQRQLVEYNLSLKASAERAAADAAYAQQVTNLNSDLAALLTNIENGTGSMADLQAIAKKYGIQINTSTIPDFASLSGTVGQLQAAIQALIAYLAKVTGYTPPSGGGGMPPQYTPPSNTTRTGTGAGSTTINVHVHGNVLTPTNLADAVHAALLQKRKRVGPLGLT